MRNNNREDFISFLVNNGALVTLNLFRVANPRDVVFNVVIKPIITIDES